MKSRFSVSLICFLILSIASCSSISEEDEIEAMKQEESESNTFRIRKPKQSNEDTLLTSSIFEHQLGQELFREHCATCHDEIALFVSAPPLPHMKNYSEEWFIGISQDILAMRAKGDTAVQRSIEQYGSKFGIMNAIPLADSALIEVRNYLIWINEQDSSTQIKYQKW